MQTAPSVPFTAAQLPATSVDGTISAGAVEQQLSKAWRQLLGSLQAACGHARCRPMGCRTVRRCTHW